MVRGFVEFHTLRRTPKSRPTKLIEQLAAQLAAVVSLLEATSRDIGTDPASPRLIPEEAPDDR